MSADDTLNDPPFSTADLTRAVGDITATGKRWRHVPEDFLVGVCGRVDSAQSHVVDGARVELSRRGVVAQRALEATTREALVAHQELITATRAAGDCASEQTAEVIRLTSALKLYTIVLAVFGALQLALMFWRR